MQNEIKKIEIILENCEVITIDGVHIGDFEVSGLETKIRRVACNSISKSTVANKFLMSVYRDANIGKPSMWTVGGLNELTKGLDRLHNSKDITSIEIHYSDDTSEQIFVTWGGNSDYNNTFQESHINKKGDLFISVEENINEEDFREFYSAYDDSDIMWRMYGCDKLLKS